MLCFIGAVSNIQAEVESLSSVRVSWNNAGFSSITDFVVYYQQTCSTSSTVVITSAPFSQNSIVIENLTEDSQYIFEVAARVIEDGRELIGDRGTSKPVELLYTPSTATANKSGRTFSETGIV